MTRDQTPDGNLSPGTVLRTVLLEGFSRPRSAIKTRGSSLAGEIDWSAVCAVAYRSRIASIMYQCLRTVSLPVPGDVMNWFRVQHYDTVARNLASLSELQAILGALSAVRIPAIVFKGPALAQLGHEMARSWKDLDLLISGAAVERVNSLLLQAGYVVLPSPPHPYHRRYATGSDSRQSVLEIHFDISDPVRSYKPDVNAIWERAVEAKILGVSARVPELMDHLLLTIMQLPHHHWSIRLLLDLWQVIARWHHDVDWAEFFYRAGAWRMMALTRSALSVLRTSFGATLPEAVLSKVHPTGYYERLHFEIARQAVNEQFEHPFRPKVMWIAPFVVVDRPSRIPAILVRRLFAGGELAEDGRVGTAFRRNMTSLAALPAVVRALVTSLARSRRDPWRGPA